jgi:predicted nucleic acid-binding protein
MIVVADTSPINYLVLIGQIDLLPHFYGRVLVPPSVWGELNDAATPETVRAWLEKRPEWLEVRPLRAEVESSLSFLDLGEREAIALAEELHAARLIADESLARAEAARRNIPVIGTLGVLRNAARSNLIHLPEALAKLQETSFFVAPELIRSLLQEDANRK